MTSRSITALSARFHPSRLTLGALAIVAASGCVGAPAIEDLEEGVEQDAAVASAEAELIRGGGSGGLGFTCSGGLCTCDKSIENDCEDMSGVCSDATVDGLINCINGWLTTHCTCSLARVATQPKAPYTVPTGGIKTFSLAR
jgi:hypothetical protein